MAASRGSPGDDTNGPVVVFGDDGSPGADVAWLWLNVHRWEGWRLDVVHVPERDVPPPPGATGALVDWEPEHVRPIFPEAGFGERRHRTSDGDPRVVLGTRSDARLVVVGSTGTGFLKRFLHLGSVTEWLLHDPSTPVLVAKRATPTRQVLAAVDGSDSATRAVETLRDLPWSGTVAVHVLGVWDGWSRADEGVAEAETLLADAGCEVSAEVLRGRPAATIASAIGERRSDLVVLGARGLGATPRTIVGSTTAQVARSTDANVLVVR